MADQMTKSIIVKGDVGYVYSLWANFENFPNFMQYIKSVTRAGDNLSHWVMEGPLGYKVEWDAETTRMEPNTRIAWNSKDRQDGKHAIKTSGQVTFRPLQDRQETEVTVMMHYDPPAGLAGEVVAALFSNPEKRLEEDLRRFKDYAENVTERSR